MHPHHSPQLQEGKQVDDVAAEEREDAGARRQRHGLTVLVDRRRAGVALVPWVVLVAARGGLGRVGGAVTDVPRERGDADQQDHLDCAHLHIACASAGLWYIGLPGLA